MFCKPSLVPEVPCLSVPACSVAVLDNHIPFCTWNMKQSFSAFTCDRDLQKYVGLNYCVCVLTEKVLTEIEVTMCAFFIDSGSND